MRPAASRRPFSAPAFSCVEIILREYSLEAIFTMMLSAMVADLIGQQFAASVPRRFPPASCRIT
jgi:hypothetical protein